MNLKTLEVSGFLPAMRGMRAPKKSYHLSDSKKFYRVKNIPNLADKLDGCDTICFDENLVEEVVVLGENDLKLAHTLLKAGTEHAKFMRQIQVWIDVDMPLYFWSEFDTYHFNSKNSESTMHKLLTSGEITSDMFVIDEEDEDALQFIINRLNTIRLEYISPTVTYERQTRLLTRAKRLLSCGWLQLRVVNTNYAELRNIWLQRVYHPHRLKEEWVIKFGEYINTLPYAEELIKYGA